MDLIGRRVSVRFRDGDGARDVVGRVLAADGAGLVVERRDGAVVPVPAGTVVAMRVVPDRPARTRPAGAFSPDELAAVTSRGWPATEAVPLGDWELRAAGGFTGRAHSACVHGDPRVDDPFAAVVDFYTARGLRPLAQVVVGSDWEREFTTRGWRVVDGQPPGAVVQVTDLRVAPAADPAVTIADQAADDWIARYLRAAETPELARSVLEGPATVGFLSLHDAAIGRIVVTGEWAGISAVEVVPDRRRTGLARRIVDTALAWAMARGADKAWLQMTSNTAAIGLYAHYGFVTHHEYTYLTPQ